MRILYCCLVSFFGYYNIKAQEQFPDSLDKKKLVVAISTQTAIYAAGLSYLSFVWYKDQVMVPFHFYNDNAGYLQIDKCGHALTAYKESYIAYYSLRNAGVTRRKSLIYGGAVGFVMQAPIEILDGIYPGWGFSWGDMIANAAGSALLVGQELLWQEQIVKLKISYQRSSYARELPELLGNNQLESFLYDYNGHTYWLSFPLNKIVHHERMPKWLNLAIGYSANGMFGEFENYSRYGTKNIPETIRYRQFLLSLDVDWTKIKTRSKFLNSLFSNMMILKVPFPAIELNSKQQFQGYWIYF